MDWRCFRSVRDRRSYFSFLFRAWDKIKYKWRLTIFRTPCRVKYYKASNNPNQPIVLLLHGWNDAASNFDTCTYKRLAEYGCVIVVTDRLTNDASGLMARQMYNAIDYVRNSIPAVVHPDKVAILGYSGGCGNGYGLLSKFPDTFNTMGAFFGMADYGYDATQGWYFTDTTFQASIAAAIGNTPGGDINKYRARYLRKGVTQNYRGGFLLMHHSPSDGLVDVSHTQNLEADLIAASRTNYSVCYSTNWAHGYPNDSGIPALQAAEPAIFAKILSEPAWTIPSVITTSSRLEVLGEMTTKLFTITLGDKVSHAAELYYNFTTNPDDFIVNPLTGSVVVTITKGNKSVTQTISCETTLTVE